MHFSEVHEFVYSAAADTLAFSLTCFLHLPVGRLHTATVRWFQAPTADPVGVRVSLVPSSTSGANAAEPSDRKCPRLSEHASLFSELHDTATSTPWRSQAPSLPVEHCVRALVL